ncbi:MFS transporter [Amnibacterium kyonggiense]|uniref:Putative MFS family arabinose efflux permease n=1 Tax=Amnibacterium kyonggiense TaxID=595671 RepID=A0A4R7FRK4_9MICO|nr:MFS transporter [Amnibacterium kyonggiense]TDS80447.1 putative MFS family arabinose efflux permease [Amnibacterium kyonggiense]
MSDGAFSPRFRVATVGVFALGFLIAFEALAVTTAMPLAARDLDGQPLYALTFSAFAAAGVIANVVAGAWSDRAGPKRPLLAGVAVFAVGLLVSGTALTMPVLIAGRALQGLGAGAIGTALYVLVARVYPETLHPRVFALLAAAWVLPSLVGPFAAGAVATVLSWHWVFVGIVPLVAAATALLLPQLRAQAMPGTGAALPRARIGWSAVAATALLAMRPLLDVPAVGTALAVLAAVVAVVALRPLLPRGALVAAAGLPAVILVRGLFSAGFAAADAYLPYSLIALRDITPVVAGAITTVGAVSWATGSELQSRFAGRLSDHRAIGLGSVAFFSGAALVGVGTWTALIAVVVVGWLCAGLGIGTAYPRLSTMTLALSVPAERGRNSAALQIADGFGNGLALTVVGVVTAFAPDGEFVGAFGLAALLGLGVLLIARRTAPPDLAR